MKTWRLILDIVVIAMAVTGVVLYTANEPTATVFGATGLATITALGVGLLGELLGILIGKDDFSTKTYFVSVAVGVVFALVLSLIVL